MTDNLAISRKTYMLRVYNPDDSSNYVDVKVVAQITVIVPYEQYWEHEYHINNKRDPNNPTKRLVRSQIVKGTNSVYTNPDPGSEELSPGHPSKGATVQKDSSLSGDQVTVERINSFPHIVPYEQYWERAWVLKGNQESNEPTPQHFLTHLFMVTGTINGNTMNDDGSFGKPDKNTYVVMQRMDTLSAVVDYEQYWEFRHLLNWPDDDVTNPDDPDKTDKSYNPDDYSSDSPAPAYRFDPFQNLIDVQWGGLAVEFGDHAQDSPAYIAPTDDS